MRDNTTGGAGSRRKVFSRESAGFFQPDFITPPTLDTGYIPTGGIISGYAWQEVVDEVMGNNAGNLSSNTRDSNSYTAMWNRDTATTGYLQSFGNYDDLGLGGGGLELTPEQTVTELGGTTTFTRVLMLDTHPAESTDSSLYLTGFEVFKRDVADQLADYTSAARSGEDATEAQYGPFSRGSSTIPDYVSALESERQPGESGANVRSNTFMSFFG